MVVCPSFVFSHETGAIHDWVHSSPFLRACFGTFCSFRIDVRFGWYNSLLLSKWGWKLPLWRCFPMEVTTRSVIVLVPTNESSHMIIFKGILQLPSRIFPPLPCSCQRSYPHDPWFPCISLRPFPFALGRWAACESGHWGSWVVGVLLDRVSWWNHWESRI